MTKLGLKLATAMLMKAVNFLAYLFFLLFIAVLVIILALLEGFYGLADSGLSIYDRSGVGQVSLYVVALVGVFVFAKFVGKDRPVWLTAWYFINWRRMISGYLALFFSTAVIVLCGYVFLALIGKIEMTDKGINFFSDHFIRGPLVLFFVILALVSTEEMIFRGFLMRYLRQNTGLMTTAGAVLFSSAVFAAVHKFQDPAGWLTLEGGLLFTGLAILGVLLCLTYIWTQSLMCAAGLHGGLVFSEFFRFRSDSFHLVPDVWWMGLSQDVRLAPIVWLLFLLMMIPIYHWRAQLRTWFAIENEIVRRGTLPDNRPELKGSEA